MLALSICKRKRQGERVNKDNRFIRILRHSGVTATHALQLVEVVQVIADSRPGHLREAALLATRLDLRDGQERAGKLVEAVGFFKSALTAGD